MNAAFSPNHCFSGFAAVLIAALLAGCTPGTSTVDNSPVDNSPAAADPAAPLFLREDWKAPAGVGQTCFDCTAETQVFVTQDLVENPNLELKMYGPGAGEVMVNRTGSADNLRTFTWAGLTEGAWAVLFKERTNYVDLSTPGAKIRWQFLISGFHLLRPVLKLADGTYLVGDQTEEAMEDYAQGEIEIADIRWKILDPVNVFLVRGAPWIDNPDLTKVDEIGYTDLSRATGHGSGGLSRVDWFEVYGNSVPRGSAAQTTSNDPLTGTWTGTWSPEVNDHRNYATVVLQWDGAALKGTLTHGVRTVELENTTFNPQTGRVHMEATVGGRGGSTYHYMIDAMADGDSIAGSWSHGDRTGSSQISGDFEIERQY
jgi:hypothetical protein